MPGPCQMPGSYADADPQSGTGASELWRRCLSRAWAVSRGTSLRYNIRSNIDDLQMKREELGLHTETLALRFVPAYLFLYQSATAPSRVTRIEHEEDDVGLFDDFVQHADVVFPLLFLRLVGSCRRRVGRGRRDVVSRCGLCELG
jgi:hypothetical protein